MVFLFGIFYFILGTLVGSFLNVVILRYEKGEVITGRSHCPSCGKMLTPYELIPIFSYIAQRGHCRACGSTLSLQYPLVEFLTGVLFVLTFLNFYAGVLSTTFFFISTLYFIVIGLLIIILVYDLRHTIIPDLFAYSFAFIALLLLFVDVTALSFVVPTLSALTAGPLLALPLFLIWLLSRGSWMGLGDAKLMLGIGWLLGLSKGVSALLLAFWLGAIVGVTLLLLPYFLHNNQLFLRGRQFTMKSEIAFGPFLILGLLLVLFLDLDIVRLLFP